MLMNQRGGTHAIEVTQRPLPLSPRYHIARSDVAAAFVAALHNPRTERATLEIVWGKRSAVQSWGDLFDHVRPDEVLRPATQGHHYRPIST